MATSLVVGAYGQDGTLLRELLARRGDDVVAVGRGDADITRGEEVSGLVKEVAPDEVYLLAAVQGSAQDAPSDPRASYEVNVLPVTYFAESLLAHAPAARLFYAASSHVFGEPDTPVQDESTPLRPTTLYGITKAAGLLHCRAYRRQGLFVSAGILYNHESPLRRPDFVSRKIVRAAARGEQVTLGSLAATVDWGHAPDYVAAMAAILRAPEPDDFVVATGEPHTVGEFAAIAFGLAGLDWRDHVREDPAVLRRNGGPLIGDASRLRAATGWRPTVNFPDMVRHLLEAELKDI
ncbi:GDP-mannose 4,6-dehydratase [Nonomuraea sp. NN258]|uniref:GDP-mannose 4,6-dehydratase n=1 Tax=Nonomuraea antri TaxID=2730852 RepID=UPI001567EEF0|nr:GDP-mannose 4,6-dehydratase [Nonomuraea antri]NRQ35800.1 GDP-mannose 4,6-dehydratase [Nonomuraea antri]